jgi:hypothetical protein
MVVMCDASRCLRKLPLATQFVLKNGSTSTSGALVLLIGIEDIMVRLVMFLPLNLCTVFSSNERLPTYGGTDLGIRSLTAFSWMADDLLLLVPDCSLSTLSHDFLLTRRLPEDFLSLTLRISFLLHRTLQREYPRSRLDPSQMPLLK